MTQALDHLRGWLVQGHDCTKRSVPIGPHAGLRCSVCGRAVARPLWPKRVMRWHIDGHLVDSPFDIELLQVPIVVTDDPIMLWTDAPFPALTYD